MVRRAHPVAREDDIAEFGEFRIDPVSRSIARRGAVIELTQKDFDLAVFLFRNLDRLLSRAHIFEAVWGQTAKINSRTIDTHVSRLRTRLGLVPANGWRLESVYQHGYRLERQAT